ncbi:hypothetical protein NDN08_006214 [Rhodosorus marinus]|uniref:Uncharacterized protein n=1 Tax=Rhodosorus marinus TaxID=101924 RepID=A0AAV8UKH0_9RHOD|nr:hypothetical protein NDN08_006214 [Rhodosorus marinus]
MENMEYQKEGLKKIQFFDEKDVEAGMSSETTPLVDGGKAQNALKKKESFRPEPIGHAPVSVRIVKQLENMTSGKDEVEEDEGDFLATSEMEEVGSIMPMIPKTESTAHVHFDKGRGAMEVISAVTIFVLVAVALVIISGISAL